MNNNIFRAALVLILLAATQCFAAPISNLKIFYVNGIQNTPTDAQASAASLTNALFRLTGGVRAEVIYNPIGFYGGSLDPNASNNKGCTAYDSTLEKVYLLGASTWRALTSPVGSTGFNFEKVIRGISCFTQDNGELATSKANEERYAAAYSANFLMESLNYNYSSLSSSQADAFITQYLGQEKPSVSEPSGRLANETAAAIRAGNKVLIVSHSQGNLIANLAWVRLIKALTPAQLANVRILNVANTSRFSPHSADFTHSEDLEIGFLLKALGRIWRRTTPDCTAVYQEGVGYVGDGSCLFKVGNVTVDTNGLIDGLTGFLSTQWDRHSFVDTYLADLPAKDLYRSSQLTTMREIMQNRATELLGQMGLGINVNQSPTAALTLSASNAATGATITFNAGASTDADGSITSYAWRFGDGATGTGVNASHAYASVGSYTVTLTVTDNAGATASAVRVVNITATPQPDLTPSAVTATPASVQPGGVVTVAWQMANSGNANAAASTTGIRLLSAATSGNGAAVNLLLNVPTGALAAGSLANQSQAITIPAGTAPGSYVVVVVADSVATSTLGQSNVANDFARSAAFTVASAAATPTSAFIDNFDGTGLQSGVWTADGAGDLVVSGGVANFSCFANATTMGKLTFTGGRIVVEGGFTGGGQRRDSIIALTDVATGDRIQGGDTNYGSLIGLDGLYLYASGAFGLPQFANSGTSRDTYMEDRLTVAGTQVTLQRGTSLANLTEIVTGVLASSINGKTFHLNIGTGGPDFCPAVFDYVAVKTYQ